MGALRLGMDGVRHGEDRGRAAVGAIERDDGRPGVVVWEVQQVVGRSGAEAVDRLCVVPHRSDTGAGTLWAACQCLDDVGLDAVDVLVLVDQDVVVPLPDAGPSSGVGQQGPPVQEQVVEVDGVVGPLARGVPAEDLADLVRVVGAPRELSPQDLGQWLLGVGDPRQDRPERGCPREPLAAREVCDDLGPDQAEQVDGVALVEDGEAVVQADRPGLAAQDLVTDRMERSPVDVPGRVVAAGSAGPPDHLRRGPPGERQQQNALRADPLGDERGHPCGEGAGLARARAGDDQQRPAPMLDGADLVGVEVGAPSRRRAGRRQQVRGLVERGDGCRGHERSGPWGVSSNLRSGCDTSPRQRRPSVRSAQSSSRAQAVASESAYSFQRFPAWALTHCRVISGRVWSSS